MSDIGAEQGNAAYRPLLDELHRAYYRAAEGKGAQRHADDKDQPFLEQPIFTIVKSLGGRPDALLFQAVKKIYESQRLPVEPGCCELRDAMVYLAAACILKSQ